MLIKINGKKLHLTTFEVTPTSKNLRRCLEMQKKVAEMTLAMKNVNVDDPESIIKSLDKQLEWLDTDTKFLKGVLNLSDDQVKKIDDSDFDDVNEFVQDVVDKILQRDDLKSEDDK